MGEDGIGSDKKGRRKEEGEEKMFILSLFYPPMLSELLFLLFCGTNKKLFFKLQHRFRHMRSIL